MPPPRRRPLLPRRARPSTSRSTSTSAAAPPRTLRRRPRLVDAFKHLFDALNPSSATASGGSSSASPAARLSAFLRQMAQSLRAGPDADATSALPRSGSLLNVSA
jgi:hypothetical protein